MQQQKIYVGMSGGVDSSVVAALLVQWGYDVTGVYMKNWSNNNGVSDTCPWEEDVAEVERVATHLGIPWKVYNFEKEYKERILNYFFAEYKAGRTPNPDILCNNLIKFDLFAQRAHAEGATHVATGHYARRHAPNYLPWETNGELGLYTALDGTKDQVYFLQRLSAEQLSSATFPLGNLYKKEVRELAKHFNLPNAMRKDSQGICFIGDIDVRDFIKSNLQKNPGDIVDVDQEKVLGRHQGLWFYTIGQRQGIGIASADEPYFVVGKNSEKNQLEVAKGHDNPLLRKQRVRVDDVHAIGNAFGESTDVLVSFRYRELPQPARLEMTSQGAVLTATSEKKFWAPAPGQGVLIYKNEDIKQFDEVSVGNSDVIAKIDTHFTGREVVRMVESIGSAIIL
jgi:tRNA-specific 2-thiouridylase